MTLMRRIGAAAVVMSAWAGWAAAQEAKPAAPAAQPAAGGAAVGAVGAVGAPITRAVWNDAGDEVRLEVVTRTLTPPGAVGPKVLLVGAVHIGEAAYYQELQKILDSADVVLFEGVKPSGLGDLPDPADAPACIAMTKAHLKLAGAMVTKFKAKHGAWPATAAELIDKAVWPAPAVVRSIFLDGWGREMLYTAPAEGGGEGGGKFDVVSLGADGKPGGEGPDADLAWSAEPPAAKEAAGEGIQAKMARALGLEFQLTSIKYDRPNFRNSDLSIDEVEKKLAAAGGGADEILKLLSGDTFMAKVAGFMFGMIERMPTMRAMMRVIMTQMLSGDAEKMMGAQPGGEKMMKVIIEDRNEAVYRDLKALVKERPELKTVAVFYGAGHFPSMLAEFKKMGYTVDESADVWLTAMRGNLKEASMTRAQVDAMAKMMEGMAKGKK